MGEIHLFVTVFVFACVFTWVEGNEECFTYDGNGMCIPPCPETTIFYSSDCISPVMSRRSCRKPVARNLGIRCDYTRCDCERPKVYDEAADKCVFLADCCDQSKVTSEPYV